MPYLTLAIHMQKERNTLSLANKTLDAAKNAAEVARAEADAAKKDAEVVRAEADAAKKGMDDAMSIKESLESSLRKMNLKLDALRYRSADVVHDIHKLRMVVKNSEQFMASVVV